MSEFDTAPRTPEFEREHRPEPAPLSPRWQVRADRETTRAALQLSADRRSL